MNRIQKKIRRLSLVGPRALAAGFDAYEENGIRLFRNLRELFFSCAGSLINYRRMHQGAIFESTEYSRIYSKIGDYRNYYTTGDGRFLVFHDASIQPLIALVESKSTLQGIVSHTPVMRDAKGSVRPLEKVRYHLEVPALHFCTTKSQLEQGRQVLTGIARLFIESLCCDAEIHENRRDVSHYADWSVSADVLIAKKPLEISAGYQLSSSFSEGLNAPDLVFFETAISSRLMIGLIGFYLENNGPRFAFPSAIAPYRINLLHTQSRSADALHFVETSPHSTKLHLHRRAGTSSFQRAGQLALGNGAPLTVIMADSQTYLIRNQDQHICWLNLAELESLDDHLRINDSIVRKGTFSNLVGDRS